MSFSKNTKIYIAGHSGLVGSAIFNYLKNNGYRNLITKSHKDLDLINQIAVENFFKKECPEIVILAAAKVGGIYANNKFRGEFIYENLMIQNNVIHNSYKFNVKKLLFLGSTCIYPKNTNQPITEDSLLTAELEYTNEPYAIAKISGIKLCESYNIQYGTNFISVMPTNLYGPHDNFDLKNSHVLPAILRKIYLGNCLLNDDWEKIKLDLDKNPINGISGVSSKKEIKTQLIKIGIEKDEIEIWGSGLPKREFLWSEDLAEACIFLMKNIDFKDISWDDRLEIKNTHINIGTGEDISIKELANLIKKIVGYSGKLRFNTSKPDGTMRKLTNVEKLNKLGWKHNIEIKDGIEKLFDWYLKS